MELCPGFFQYYTVAASPLRLTIIPCPGLASFHFWQPQPGHDNLAVSDTQESLGLLANALVTWRKRRLGIWFLCPPGMDSGCSLGRRKNPKWICIPFEARMWIQLYGRNLSWILLPTWVHMKTEERFDQDKPSQKDQWGQKEAAKKVQCLNSNHCGSGRHLVTIVVTKVVLQTRPALSSAGGLCGVMTALVTVGLFKLGGCSGATLQA